MCMHVYDIVRDKSIACTSGGYLHACILLNVVKIKKPGRGDGGGGGGGWQKSQLCSSCSK